MDEVAAKAAAYDSHICTFPEKFNTGYAITLEQCHELAETVDGRSVTRAREVARSHGVAVILPYPERDDSGSETRYYDSIAFAGADGSLLQNYRKTHLYGAAERRNYSFGNELPPVTEVNGFNVGLLNCYECEFPPLYQYLAEAGAHVLGLVGHQLADRAQPAWPLPFERGSPPHPPSRASAW